MTAADRQAFLSDAAFAAEAALFEGTVQIDGATYTGAVSDPDEFGIGLGDLGNDDARELRVRLLVEDVDGVDLAPGTRIVSGGAGYVLRQTVTQGDYILLVCAKGGADE